MRDYLEEMAIIGGFLVMVFLLFAGIIAPLCYLEGKAKSAWIKGTNGAEVPWYEAAFLDIQINGEK